jgi:anti-anti-sigma regulatory factor
LESEKRVTLRERCGIPIIEISGTVSGSIEKDLLAAHKRACQSQPQPQNILIKFVSHGRIYSSGINALIKLIVEAEKRGQKVCATGLSNHFFHIFSLTALTKHIQVFPSEEEALDVLTKGCCKSRRGRKCD